MKKKLHFFLGCLLATSVFQTVKAQNVPEMMYYKFDAPGTSAINDASAPVGTNPAPITGTSLTIGGTGQFGTALTGNGTASEFVNTGWNTSLATGDWTISFWMNNVTASSTLWYLFGDNGNSFRCFVNGAPGSGNMRLTGTGLTSVDVTGVTGGSFVMHFVRETTPASVIKVYKNGVLAVTVPVTITMATGTGLRIGSYGTNNGLNGQMDEFRIYNRALSQSEIDITWNSMLPLGACTSPPTAGTTTASSTNVCTGSSVALGLTGNTFGTGQTYQWEQSASSSGPWAPIAGATGQSTIVNPTATMYYHAVVTCSGLDAVSTPIQVTVPAPFPGGTYTVNNTMPTDILSGGTNFNSFLDFTTATACGIAGPIVVNVNTATYAEPILMGSIGGVSSTNTITINGNNATLAYTSTNTNQRGIITMDGTDYVTVNNFIINAYNTSTTNYGWGVFMTNDANNNTVNGCTVILDSNTTSTNYVGIAISGSPTSPTTVGSNCDNITLTNNTVIGGYAGITLMGNTATGVATNCNVSNNVLRNFYIYGLYAGGTDNALIESNDISRPHRTTLTTFGGVYMLTYNANLKVRRNRIHDPATALASNASTYYGIYLSASTPPAGSENEISNNIIYNFNGAGAQYCLYNTSSGNVRYYHNSISSQSTVSGTAITYGFYQTTAAAGIELRNNIFMITRNTTGNKVGIYMNSGVANFSSNYNSIYVAGAGTNNYIGYATALQATLANWQTASSGQDLNSQTMNPIFASEATGNLAPTNSLLDNLGIPLALVTTDILGVSRDPSTPDIGAYEFTIPPCGGTPTAGTAAASVSSACTGMPIQLTLTGFTTGVGISVEWQSSPAGMASWTTISTGLANITTTMPSQSTDYQAIVTCANGGGQDFSATVPVTLSPFYSCYCSPLTGTTLHSTTGNYITAVSIPTTTLSVTTSAVGAGGYTQHNPATATNTATLVQGQSYTLNASISSASYSTELWIDWDQNGNFDASEYQQLSNATAATATILVPLAATPGTTGMRLRNVASTTTLYGASGACSNITIGRETEDFAITIAPVFPCAGTPTATGTATASPSSVCYGNPISLNATGYTTDLNVTLQWESSPAGQNTWTPIANATTASFSYTGATANTDFHLALTCNNAGGGTGYSNMVTVAVNNPQLLGTAGATICGQGTATISATPDAGASVNWYANATGGSTLATGNTYTTPVLTSTTTYYAAASSGGSTATLGLPNRVGATTNSGYSDVGLMFDATSAFTLQSVAVYPVGTGGTVATTIQLKNSAGTVLQTTTVNLTTSATPGIKTVVPLNFQVPTGTGHRLVLNGATGGGISGFIRESGTGYTYPYTVPGVASITSAYTGGASSAYYYYFYDWQITSGCEGARQPVTVTVNTAPSITATATPDSICLGSSSTLNVSSANTNYSYTWTGGATGSSTSVSPTVTSSYIVNAFDATTSCAAADTVEVAVKSTAPTVTTGVNYMTVCVNENLSFTLNPVPTAGITYQWQKDAGSGYTDIPGATASSYTEAASSSGSYRARMFCSGNLVNTSVPVAVTVNNPSISATFPGARCAAGQVTLAATAATGLTVRWYDAPTAGSLVGSGGAFTTPSISANTTYYAAAEAGSIATVGPTSPAIGTYAAWNSTAQWLNFSVLSPTTIQSVDMFFTSAVGSTFSVVIRDAASLSVVHTYNGTVSVSNATPTTAQVVPINAVLAPGNYQMNFGTATGTFRNSTGGVYPYTIPGVLSITGNTFDVNYYYMFYRWVVGTSCIGTRVPVVATVNAAPSGTGLSTGGTTTGTIQADGSTVGYGDACGDVIASITDAAGGNVLGVTSAVVLTSPSVLTHNALPYVPRAYDITPTSNGPATLTIYALQSEFNAYNSYVLTNGLSQPLLPTSPVDVVGISNIVVTQFHGGALSGTTGPLGLYNNSNTTFIQNSNITVNWTGQYWAMTFPVTGFSGFFIHTGSSPLLIKLGDIAAVNVGNRNRVDWNTVSEEAGDRFEIERSADGASYSQIGIVGAKGSAASYSFWDNAPVSGVNYYRLKMMDAAGNHAYSKVVKATVNDMNAFTVEAYPNPVKNIVTVKAHGAIAGDAKVVVTDATGKVVRTAAIVNNMTTIDMEGLAQGMYLVKYTDNVHSQSIKINKQ